MALMTELVAGLDARRVRANLEGVREEVTAAAERAGRGDAAEVQILAAVKYVPTAELPVLAEAGIGLLGENRAQDLQEKVAATGETFTWDFIGAVQSRKVRTIVPHVRLIHSIASESALGELAKHRDRARPGLEVLIEVNLSGEHGKAGIAPERLDEFIQRCPVPVAGLMTMPPLAERSQDSRRWFAALRELAQGRRLRHLSMGTTQDFAVAVEEGATIVRIGTRLYR